MHLRSNMQIILVIPLIAALTAAMLGRDRKQGKLGKTTASPVTLRNSNGPNTLVEISHNTDNNSPVVRDDSTRCPYNVQREISEIKKCWAPKSSSPPELEKQNTVPVSTSATFQGKLSKFFKSWASHSKKKHWRKSIFPRRTHLFEEFVELFRNLSAYDLKYVQFIVQFTGEKGYDMGGLNREWFDHLTRAILEPERGLFQLNTEEAVYELVPFSRRSSARMKVIDPPHPADTNDKVNNHQESIVESRRNLKRKRSFGDDESGETEIASKTIRHRGSEHPGLLYFVGQFLAKAILQQRQLPVKFGKDFYRRLLDQETTYQDLQDEHPRFCKSMLDILQGDVSGYGLYFSDDIGYDTQELKKGGADIDVTEDNKAEYVVRLVQSRMRLRNSVEEQMGALKRGFLSIISKEYLSIFGPEELSLMLSGPSIIDVGGWQACTEYQDCTVDTTEIRWFWNIVESYSQAERAALLQFVTGSSQIPPTWMLNKGSPYGIWKFCIKLAPYVNPVSGTPIGIAHLQAHTCYNKLQLSYFEREDHLRTALKEAVLYTAFTLV